MQGCVCGSGAVRRMSSIKSTRLGGGSDLVVHGRPEQPFAFEIAKSGLALAALGLRRPFWPRTATAAAFRVVGAASADGDRSRARKRLPGWEAGAGQPIFAEALVGGRLPARIRTDSEKLFIDYEATTTGWPSAGCCETSCFGSVMRTLSPPSGRFDSEISPP